jgi:hypothetical protein
MNELKVAPRILTCFVAAFLVAVFAFCIRPIVSESITLGTIADKSGNHSQRPVLASNCVGWKQFGQYLVIPSPRIDRYPVVFRLASTDAIPVNCTTFTGVCRGVQVDILDGCPCDPPFVLIDNVKPDEREQ